MGASLVARLLIGVCALTLLGFGSPDWNKATLPAKAQVVEGKLAFDIQGSGGYGIGVVNLDGSDWKQIAPVTMIGAPSWSPDGKRIAFSYRDTVHVMNADGSGLKDLGHRGTYTDWTPDGSRVIAGSNGLDEIDPDSGEVTRLFDTEFAGKMSLSPDGKRIALDHAGFEFTIRDYPSGNVVARLADDLFAMDPDWSPDGSTIAFSSYSPESDARSIWIMDAEGKNPRPLFPPSECVPAPDAAAGALLCPSDDDPAWSPDGTQIAFIRDTEAIGTDPGCTGCRGSVGTDIGVVNVDGSGLRQVTQTAEQEREPDWQPVPQVTPGPAATESGPGIASQEGSARPSDLPLQGKIAFLRDYKVWVINADGSGELRLSEDGLFSDYAPDWSPDGSKIVFSRQEEDPLRPREEVSLPQVFVMNADGSNVTQLTNEPYGAGEPAWSPDGNQIGYVSGSQQSQQTLGDCCYELHVMDANGGNDRVLNRDANSDDISWSPDGSKIAFGTRRGDYRTSVIFTIAADGSDERRLSSGGDVDWSPNGPRLAFAREGQSVGVLNILVINPDEGDPRELIIDGQCSLETSPVCPPSRLDPAWSPDGTQIAYWRYGANGAANIWRVGADGNNERQLTFSTSFDIDPDWQPIPISDETESGTELTVQAAALIALGVLAAGSLVALPVAALWRRRR